MVEEFVPVEVDGIDNVFSLYGASEAEGLAWLKDREGDRVKLKCGCILLHHDGSKIPCWKHTSPQLKKVVKESVRY
jgi:hypothetical protein